MKHLFTFTLAAGIAIAGISSQPLRAADKLAGWDVGKVQCGDEEVAKDLKGKVVVIEYWGTR